VRRPTGPPPTIRTSASGTVMADNRLLVGLFIFAFHLGVAVLVL
jgi:hypothetical protein